MEPEGPDDRSELTALATGAMQASDVPLRIFAAALPGDTDGAKVAVTIEVTEPRSAIETADGLISDRLEYQVMAVNERSGRATQILSNTATVASAGPRTGLAEPNVRIHLPMTLTLRPGTYSVRASVTSEQLGRGGSVYLTLSVPDFRSRPTLVGSIVLGSTLEPEPASPRPNGPGDPIPFSPSLDREFMRADALQVLFNVVRSGDQAVDVRLEAIDIENQVVMTMSERLSQGQPGRVLMTLPLERLEPGAYRPRAVATTPAFTDQHEVGYCEFTMSDEPEDVRQFEQFRRYVSINLRALLTD